MFLKRGERRWENVKKGEEEKGQCSLEGENEKGQCSSEEGVEWDRVV